MSSWDNLNNVAVAQDETRSLLSQRAQSFPCHDAVIESCLDDISKKAKPGVRRFWFLPHIDPPYPVIEPRELIEPSTLIFTRPIMYQALCLPICSIPYSRLISRLTVRFSCLSLSDRFTTSSAAWSRLERLPPEILILITTHLAFWDKKALSSVSQRIYYLLGPIEPPDRFSWRIHILTSFNLVPSEYFDVTILRPDEVKSELTRIVKQIPRKQRRGHYNFDPRKTRLKDLTCLYYPFGFHTSFRGKRIRCRTLGQFVAIQVNEYIARLLKETKQEESLAMMQRCSELDNDVSYEQRDQLAAIASKWRDIHGQWEVGTPGSRSARLTLMASPSSGWDESLDFLLRMGYETLCGRIRMYGRICEVGKDEGTEYGSDAMPETLNSKKRSIDDLGVVPTQQ